MNLEPLHEDFNYLSEFHQMQVIMAASGCISGSLVEWPYLLSALCVLGFDVSGDTTALEARRICRQLVKGRIN